MKYIIERMKLYNEWRRGAETLQPSPMQIGEDLDAVITAAERYEKLRKLNPHEFMNLYRRNLDGEDFDAMMDML